MPKANAREAAKARAASRRGKPRIAAAAMLSSGGARSAVSGLGKAIEQAMSGAIMDCYDKGIIDPEKQREAMLAARAKVVGQHSAIEAKVSKELSKGQKR